MYVHSDIIGPQNFAIASDERFASSTFYSQPLTQSNIVSCCEHDKVAPRPYFPHHPRHPTPIQRHVLLRLHPLTEAVHFPSRWCSAPRGYRKLSADAELPNLFQKMTLSSITTS